MNRANRATRSESEKEDVKGVKVFGDGIKELKESGHISRAQEELEFVFKAMDGKLNLLFSKLEPIMMAQNYDSERTTDIDVPKDVSGLAEVIYGYSNVVRSMTRKVDDMLATIDL